MVDPFSIVAGTLSLIDVCWRFGVYLHDVQAGAAKIDDEIASLSREIEHLQSVNESVCATYKEIHKPSSKQEASLTYLETHWRLMRSNLQDCQLLVEALEGLVREIIGKETLKEGSKVAKKFDGFKKQLKKQSREQDFYKLQGRLTTYYGALQFTFSTIILTHAQQSHSGTDDVLKELKNVTGKSHDDIKDQLASLKSHSETDKVLEELKNGTDKSLSEVRDQLASLQNSLSSQNTEIPHDSNEHFYVPQGVEKNYTGRSSSLEAVRYAFTAPSGGEGLVQKRIVIYGLGGSGKTQFCCQYAQLYRQNYWGIFWIDASSDKLAKQTFQRIGKIGGKEPNVSAAKSWLTNLKTHWLLIIDNADDPQVKIANYFPEGERGHVLVTTRIPAQRQCGTAGQRFYRFEGLQETDANTLLLKTADKPVPGNSLTQKLASSIAKALGFLPLALIQAGRAIFNNLCTLEDYLIYHRRERQTLLPEARFCSFRRGDSDTVYLNVYSSFEINLQGLKNKVPLESKEGATAAKDAIELLQMFSLFHSKNIRFEFLTNAMTNPKKEREEQLDEQKRLVAIETSTKVRSWASILRDMVTAAQVYITTDRTPPVLPESFRDIEGAESEKEFRLREALNELNQLSLITYNDDNDNYSIHPLVHTWVRERPDFVTGDQAVWRQAATNTLAQCILLPPLANTDADERLRRDLLPHIEHMRERQQEFRDRLNENQKKRWTSWLLTREKTTGTQIMQLAKFSRVYAQRGRWDEAKELQLAVKDFVSPLGPEHPSNMKIKLALAGTFWQLGRGNEAAELQSEVLQASISSLGEQHPSTLKVMDLLGESRRQQGRFTDALKLHEQALRKMTETLGENHEDTLKATDNLGQAHTSHWQRKKAREFHERAVDGMGRNPNLGPTHLNTLIAMHNLATAHMENDEGDYSDEPNLKRAFGLLLDVLRCRGEKLGKEHPYTLWAAADLARVKGALGDLSESETDIRAGLTIVVRNLGEEHIGVLCGKLYLGEILIKQEYFQEAAELLTQVADMYRRTGAADNGEHPDRVRALGYLSRCFELQGNFEEAICTSDEAIKGLEALGGHFHPYMSKLKGNREALIESRNNVGNKRLYD